MCGDAKAGNRTFMVRSAAKSTRSSSTNITVSPRVWPGPSHMIRTRTPPRSSTISRSKTWAGFRKVTSLSRAAISGDRAAKLLIQVSPISWTSCCCAAARRTLALAGNATSPVVCSG